MSAWLRRLPRAQSDLQKLVEMDQIFLAVGNAEYGWVGRGLTLKQVVQQQSGWKLHSIKDIGVQLGHEAKPVTRRTNGGTQPFPYAPDTKLRETIIEHGDRLHLF